MIGKFLLASALAATALAAPAVEERAVRNHPHRIDKMAARQNNGPGGMTGGGGQGGGGSGACAPLYGTCGGSSNPNSPTCCESGSYCNALNSYYSQCVPGSGPSGGNNGGGGNGTSTMGGGQGGESQQPNAQPSTAEPSQSSGAGAASTPDASGGMQSTTTSAGAAGGYPIAAASDTPQASAGGASNTLTAAASDPPATSIPALLSVSPNATATGATNSSGAPEPSAAATIAGNPYAGASLWANKYYASEVSASAIPVLSGAMATKAAAAAQVPAFMWLDTASKITSLMAPTLADIKAAGSSAVAQFVVYDLPDRDCAAAASNGEYSIANNGLANYKAYIDGIVTLLKQYSDIKTVLVIEPDSLANLVTNMSVQKCANAKSTYLTAVNYAITQLNLPNVAMYLDAGHAGWLGWSANLTPAAQLFAQVYKNASSPASVRGLATNVANYNAWSIATPPSYTQGDSNYDEEHYINALAPLLSSNGWSSARFIVDTSRNGVQPTKQIAWGDWCNLIGTGFGVRPTSSTGSSYVDAFAWVKPGGECDGTSNTSAARYDFHCGQADALQPAPEAGAWFEAYFEQLLTNANPSF